MITPTMGKDDPNTRLDYAITQTCAWLQELTALKMELEQRQNQPHLVRIK